MSKKKKFRFDLTEEEIKENTVVVNKHFDREYTIELVKNILSPIAKIWFRVKYVGFEDFPQRNNPERPLIFITNHSGMAFPWDGIMFMQGIIEKYKFTHNFTRPLVSPMLTDFLYMSPYLIKNIWQTVSSVDATYKNFDTVMNDERHNVLIYPEGVPGIAKGFPKRYQLQEFKNSFIRMSIKYKTDIVCFSTINAEYNNPYTYRWKKFNKLVNKIGIPFMPLGFTTLFVIIQPWFFYFSFPSKMTFVMGKRIKPYEMLDKPYEDVTHQEFRDLSRKVRAMMQEDLTKDREKYGKQPYKIGELIKTLFINIKSFPRFFFVTWALIMHEFDWQYRRNKKDTFKFKANIFRIFTILIKKPFIISLFIPIIGWIPIIIKSIRDRKRREKLKTVSKS